MTCDQVSVFGHFSCDVKIAKVQHLPMFISISQNILNIIAISFIYSSKMHFSILNLCSLKIIRVDNKLHLKYMSLFMYCL